MKEGDTITVYNTDSHHSSEPCPFKAIVLDVREDEALVESKVTGRKYWLYNESFEEEHI
jgi:hypothetical protein